MSRAQNNEMQKNRTMSVKCRNMDTEPGSTTEPATTDTAQPPRKRPPGRKASVNEKIHVLNLNAEGVRQTEIARITGISQQAVSDIINRHHPTTARAMDVLRANSFKAAEDWIRSFNVAVKRGEHRPMRDVLIATGVVAPDPQAQGITVVVGSGDVSIEAKVASQPTHNPILSLPNPDEAL
jgi:hypothetical protein